MHSRIMEKEETVSVGSLYLEKEVLIPCIRMELRLYLERWPLLCLVIFLLAK